MKSGPLRWLMLFFTRPIRASDITAAFRALKPRPKAEPAVPEPMAAPAASRREARVVAASAARPKGDGSIRAVPTSIRASLIDVGISEQPLDSLPAELQSEFGSSAHAALDAARAREASRTANAAE